MNTRLARSCLVAAIALSALGTGACVNSPLHNEYVDPTDGTRRFDGLAQGPNRRIDVQARRKDTGQWVTIAVTASRSSPYTLANGDRGFYYKTDVDIEGIGSWRCFYHSSCTTPNGILWAQYRVLEQGSPMVTFTLPEAQCINDRLMNHGDGALEAYETCGGTYRRTMTLYWDHPFTFPGDPPGKL